MRLLRVDDDARSFSLVDFFGRDIPPYAILSHTWGPDDDEVTYQDLLNGEGVAKPGYDKLKFCARQAAKDHLCYFWVDTCCIDKKSSAELSEAITSMFRWYHNSARCYVHLVDVEVRDSNADHTGLDATWKSDFLKSRWFTRGWTLQELLASPNAFFYSKDGTLLGDKVSLEQQIYDVTQVPKAAIRGALLDDFDIEERISWIEKRHTTREEDMAYSLLGILNISMLPNYGEGKDCAFKRLERECKEAHGDTQQALRAEKRKMLLESLYFAQIETRQMTIKTAHARTCTWLLQDPQYLRWLDEDEEHNHHGFLWIKGKPGAGKSTLMKFAVAQAYAAEKVIISFFFNARGDRLERSTIGTYRSLLFQLLDRVPSLQRAFDNVRLPGSDVDTEYKWTVEALEAALERVILLLKEYRVVCYIDALDECEDEQVRQMIRFLEAIGDRTISAGIHFHICFSSRHYPHITIRHGISLVLEGQEGHSCDITDYLKSELAIGQSTIAEDIRHEVQRKASGVFMWVVLVVKILNKDYDRGHIHALRRRLQEIPRDLHNLLRDILMRGSHNRQELVLCIQWVLFAKRPLSATELYFAILCGLEPDALSSWNKEIIDHDVIKRFILDSSRGLTEFTKAEAQEDQKIQFIHESVRDFLLKDDGLGKVWPEFKNNFVGESHHRLKHCCLDYITMDAITSSIIKPATDTMPMAVLWTFPFLQYSMQSVLYHAEAAELGGISQRGFLRTFPLTRWIELNNLLEDFLKYTKDVDLPYLLAERNMVSLLQVQDLGYRCVQPGTESLGCPLFAAAARGGEEVVEYILEWLMWSESSYCVNTSTKSLDHYCQALFEGIDWRFGYSSWRGVLSYAAEFGIAPVVNSILHRSANEGADAEDDKGRTPLWWASSAGQAETVALLLATDSVDVNSMDQNNVTPLHVAAERGHPHVVQMLLDHGCNINDTEQALGWALLAAGSGRTSSHKEVSEVLLNTKKINVDALSGNGMTSLIQAAYIGDESVVALLLRNGANVNAQDDDGYTALTRAIDKSHEAVVKLLLANGADIHIQGGYWGNALQAAIVRGYKGLAELLILRSDADVNQEGGHYGSALQAAARGGRTSIVELLIKHGADVNAHSGLYCSALQAASLSGHEEIARLLVQEGASAYAQCERRSTAFAAVPPCNQDRYHQVLADLLWKHDAIQEGYNTDKGVMMRSGRPIDVT